MAEITCAARKAGRPIDAPADARIAAIALHYNVPLITNNGADFAGVRACIC